MQPQPQPALMVRLQAQYYVNDINNLRQAILAANVQGAPTPWARAVMVYDNNNQPLLTAYINFNYHIPPAQPYPNSLYVCAFGNAIGDTFRFAEASVLLQPNTNLYLGLPLAVQPFCGKPSGDIQVTNYNKLSCQNLFTTMSGATIIDRLTVLSKYISGSTITDGHRQGIAVLAMVTSEAIRFDAVLKSINTMLGNIWSSQNISNFLDTARSWNNASLPPPL